MIPERTQRNARQLESKLTDEHGEHYAAVIARAGMVRSTDLSTSGAPITEAQKARNDGLEEGLLLAVTAMLNRSGMTHRAAEDSARSDIARMASAIKQDDQEFLNDPAWSLPY